MVAENGNRAIEILKNSTFDLILMDIQLPDLSGLEVIRKIREFNKQIPIIAQTAYALQSDQKESIEAGCTDYISKPIKRTELFEKINKIK